MSALDDIRRALTDTYGTGIVFDGLTADDLITNAVAENQLDAQIYPGELLMLRGLVRVLRSHALVHGDLAAVQKALIDHAADDSHARDLEKARTSAPATRDRRQILLGRITTELGQWTTRRTSRTYQALGITGVFRSAVRADLSALHKAGHLDLHDENPGCRFYTYAVKGRS